MSIHVSPERPAGLHRRDRGFLTRNPWGVRRDRVSRTLVWLPLGALSVALVRDGSQASLLVLAVIAAGLGAHLVLEVQRESRRGWISVSREGGGPREPVWHDPHGVWVEARDGLWRPVRVTLAVVPVAALLVGALMSYGETFDLAVLVAWPVVLYVFRHVPTGSAFDVAYHCQACGVHGAYRLCRKCGRESASVRPPTVFGSVRRRWTRF